MNKYVYNKVIFKRKVLKVLSLIYLFDTSNLFISRHFISLPYPFHLCLAVPEAHGSRYNTKIYRIF